MASQLILGILGGGQLGRMMAIAARALGVKRIRVLDPDENCPSKNIAHEHIVGSFRNKTDVLAFSKGCDVITVEIEHVDTAVLQEVEAQGIPVRPAPSTIAIIQDKHRQKQHLSSHGIPLANYRECNQLSDLDTVAQHFSYPFILKSKFGAYDGRGNCVVKSPDELATAWQRLGGKDLYAEKMVNFTKELAVSVARSEGGEQAVFPPVETIQKDNICHIVHAPAQISAAARQNAMRLAMSTVATFKGAGVYAVEMFLLPNDTTLVNEVAPRVHNSGHYTIEACATSQFEQHVRAVLELPLGDPNMIVPAACMYNVLGHTDLLTTLAPIKRALTVAGAHVHWYEKTQVKDQRKMGHITVVGTSASVVRQKLREITLEESKPETEVPLVGIIMGSDSDLPRIKPAAELLKDFKVPFEVNIVSAHRTPLRMVEYARTAHERGLRVIIAGAGGAAHLPGMVASMTPLPVVGVPVRIEPLNGEDALLSIVQMPAGVPVATVGVNNSSNAALLAVRILGASDTSLREQMIAYQKKMETTVLNKAEHLTKTGWENYSWPPPK